MTKREIRTRYLDKRQLLTESEFAALNEKLINRFFKSVDFTGIRTFHCYLPIRKFREPDTMALLERLQHDFPATRIVIPAVDSHSENLLHYYYEGAHQLSENQWGIPEVQDGVPAMVDSVDLVLVPLLAFDRKGFRVGYGKGYYDKFLAECRPDCVKLGLSFFPPVESIEPVEWFDVKLDRAITPDAIFDF